MRFSNLNTKPMYSGCANFLFILCQFVVLTRYVCIGGACGNKAWMSNNITYATCHQKSNNLNFRRLFYKLRTV